MSGTITPANLPLSTGLTAVSPAGVVYQYAPPGIINVGTVTVNPANPNIIQQGTTSA